MQDIFKKNREWAEGLNTQKEGFFESLSHAQHPEYLWIGCSDSRVPANQLMGLLPGEVFVHRNIANVVVHADFNALSVIHYAVEHLKVKHIIVCGHYGCGGVSCALSKQRYGLVDSWLEHIKAVARLHEKELESLPPALRVNRLCELNVLEQVKHVCVSPPVLDAWQRGQPLSIHSWIYNLKDGLLHTLQAPIDKQNGETLFLKKGKNA